MSIARADLLLACASGGHLSQLLALREAWEDESHLWVTESTADAHSLLAGEPVVYAHGPAHRNLDLGAHRIALAWLRNIVLGARVAVQARPRVVLTTGGAVAVPFVWAARLLGARVVYIESLTRVDTLSTSCRLISPIADRLYVQWPELAELVPNARYAGSVLGTS
jgi:UDP-N-acetylglucosamine:LPS N-acetylglucosamine transferase